MSAVKRDENNEILWGFFETINFHYVENQVSKSSKETNVLLIQCMLDLLRQLDPLAFSPTEKVSLQTAHAYWLENTQELEPVMLLLCALIESKIHYRAPQHDHRLLCVAQVLSIDKDYFDDMPEFLENIHLAGLPIENILKTARRCFSHISDLH